MQMLHVPDPMIDVYSCKSIVPFEECRVRSVEATAHTNAAQRGNAPKGNGNFQGSGKTTKRILFRHFYPSCRAEDLWHCQSHDSWKVRRQHAQADKGLSEYGGAQGRILSYRCGKKDGGIGGPKVCAETGIPESALAWQW
jgi:hypothetical protein